MGVIPHPVEFISEGMMRWLHWRSKLHDARPMRLSTMVRDSWKEP